MSICKLCPNCERITYEQDCNCGFIYVENFISLDDYFMCRSNNRNHLAYLKDFRYVAGYKEDWSQKIQANAADLVKKVNTIFSQIDKLKPLKTNPLITSGWRPSAYNKEIGGTLYSNHQKGLAIDIQDIGNYYWDILNNNLSILKEKGMAMEHKKATPTWLHLQTVLPRSGNTIFMP